MAIVWELKFDVYSQMDQQWLLPSANVKGILRELQRDT